VTHVAAPLFLKRHLEVTSEGRNGNGMRSLILVLALAGVVVSSLSLQAHYSSHAEPAISRSHWNSSLVNHSPYSTVAGIPVAAFGVVGYAAVGLLAFLRRRALTSIFTLFGLAYALYLTKIEAQILNVWCVYSVVSRIVMALITLLTLGQLIFSSRPATRGLTSGGDSPGRCFSAGNWSQSRRNR